VSGAGPVLAPSKLRSLAEAAELVPDGARLTLGGVAVYQHPMAMVRQLIRLGRTGLTVIGVLNGPELDMLIAGGCVSRVETSYVGLERFGLAPNFRRAVERGTVTVEDYSEGVAFDRFRASEDGLTFLATPALAGTDILRSNPRLRPFECPLTGRPYVAVPPADPDVVVIHAVAADERGNVFAPRSKLLPQGFDEVKARSSDTVVVTAERIVPRDFASRNPELMVVPGLRVTAVVEAPWGAHPCSSLGSYELDVEHFEEYVAASADDEGVERYLDRYARGPSDQAAYLELIGVERLVSLQSGAAL
jgi:glutaconate CoA-transferase subunit A